MSERGPAERIAAELYAQTGVTASGTPRYAIPSGTELYSTTVGACRGSLRLGTRDGLEPGAEVHAEIDIGVVAATIALRAAYDGWVLRVPDDQRSGWQLTFGPDRPTCRGIAPETLAQRRSRRQYGDPPVRLDDLRRVAGECTRAVPAAVVGESAGHRLLRAPRDDLVEIFHGQQWVADASQIVMVEAGGERLERAHARACGAAAMAWHLAAEQTGLASCIIGSIDDVRLDQWLPRPSPATVRLAVAVGHRV